jgi:hypothetical protein
MAHRNHTPARVDENHGRCARFLAIFTIFGALAACGGTTSNGPASPTAPTAVAPSITGQPQNTSVAAGQAAAFSVTATGTAPLSYQWRKAGSAIAGATAATYTTAATSAADSGEVFSVVVTNSAGAVTSGNATLTVTAASTSALSITTSSLPGGIVQSAYAATLQASGGKTPYAWSVASGQLPAGLALSATTGTISGTPTAAGSSSFTVSVHDANGSDASASLSLTVSAAASSLRITPSALPAGVVQSPYTATLLASGGKTPYAWSVVSGQLPAGLALSATTGTISGTPTAAGSSSFTVGVHDAAGASATLATSISIGAASTTVEFGHVVIVVEENADYATVVGAASTMPYLNSLIDSYGLATQYYANTHPSIGNYMMLVTGQVLTNDDNETPASFPVSVNNVVRELAANGKTWKAYAEDLPSVGYTGGDTGNYAVRHVPLAYLTDVQDSATGRDTLVPFTQFATDLASGSLPNYSFVTPNLCNDAHNCALSVADSWLQINIAPLLTSSPFKDDGLLIIVFDESADDNTNGGGRIPAVFISPKFSKAGYQSATLYQHESTLRLMLEGLGITTDLPGAAATAPTMWQFFDTAP